MGPTALGWEPHPEVWLLGVALMGGYFYALSAWGPRHAPGRPPASRRHQLYFVLGVVTMWVAADWPTHQLAGELFSVHMAQHMAFSFVSAPLLILGTPGWLLRVLLSPGPVRAVWAWMTRPFTALLLFNGFMLYTHWPALVDLSVRNDLAHFGLHLLLYVVSLAMWWPVLSPLPELPHLDYPWAMAYLFGQSVLPTIPASFLTYSGTALFETYALTTPLWGLAATMDQQIAGLLMKIGGGLLLWAVICALFFRWHHEEETGGPDIRYWRDLAPAVTGSSPTGSSPGSPTTGADHPPPNPPPTPGDGPDAGPEGGPTER